MSKHNQPQPQPQLKIPTFEPLPPSNLANRLINKILAPLFYLLFSILISVVVVPLYTIVQNIKGKAGGRRSRSGGGDHSGEGPGASAESHGGGQSSGRAKGAFGEYLTAYGGSYGKQRRMWS